MDDLGSLRRFAEDTFLGGRRTTGDPLAEADLDSLAVEQLVEFLEGEYGVSFADDELEPGDLGSLGAVAALVDGKLAEAA